jgi:hypothetical protein
VKNCTLKYETLKIYTFDKKEALNYIRSPYFSVRIFKGKKQYKSSMAKIPKETIKEIKRCLDNILKHNIRLQEIDRQINYLKEILKKKAVGG